MSNGLDDLEEIAPGISEERYAEPHCGYIVWLAGNGYVTAFQFGDVNVDLASRRVTRAGQPVKLTATEYALLRLFIQHAGKVLTHYQILREVWGPNHQEKMAYLRVYMARLREKLEADTSSPTLFLTEPGVGYRLSVSP